MKRALVVAAVVLVVAVVAYFAFAPQHRAETVPIAIAPQPKAEAQPVVVDSSGVDVVSERVAAPTAPSPSIESAAPAKVEDTSGLARVHGHLVDTSGVDQAHGAFLLIPLDAAGAPRASSKWRQSTTDDKGHFTQVDLEPGAWRVIVAPTYRAPLAADVELEVGDNEMGDIVFAPLVEAGSVKVRLEDPRGSYAGGVLALRSVGDSNAVDRWNVIGEGPEFWVDSSSHANPMQFEFEHLPAGEYDVTFFPGDGRSARARVKRATVPGEEVVFELVDEGEAMLVVRARDAVTKAPISAVLMIALDERGGAPLQQAVDFDVRCGPIARDARRDWILLAPEHKPRAVRAVELRNVDGALLLEVELERGFGALVIARDADRMCSIPCVGYEIGLRRERLPTLSDVEVFADRAAVGRTNLRGACVVSLDAPPYEWLALAPGRVLVDADNLVDGRVKDARWPVVQVWLASTR